MPSRNFCVYYEGVEYISSAEGDISLVSKGVSISPYKVVSDILKKYRMSRSRYEVRSETSKLRAHVKIIQHDLWYAHEASVNFTVYWHPGMEDGAFHIYKFSTRISDAIQNDAFEMQHKLYDYDKYMVSLSRWDTDLQELLGCEITFLPVLVITAMRDNNHALWDRGKAKGMKYEM